MKQQIQKIQEVKTEEGQLIEGRFPIEREPVDYQLSVHVNNILLTYSKDMVKHFKELLTNPSLMTETYSSIQVRQVIAHYGIPKCREWFTMVYGWEFATPITDSVTKKVVIKKTAKKKVG